MKPVKPWKWCEKELLCWHAPTVNYATSTCNSCFEFDKFKPLPEGCILEKSPEQFTVVHKGKHFGFFCSRAGAEAFLEALCEPEKINVDTTGSPNNQG